MNTLTVDEAFGAFRQRATSRGLSDLAESRHPEAFGSRLLSASNRGAGPRLVWDGKEESLVLEITHGDALRTSWLDLFSARCLQSIVPAPAPEEPTFLAALEYGLDLMLPAGHA